MRVGPVIEAFARNGCLDLLASPERRASLIAALIELSARIRAGEHWVPVDPTLPLPWAWGFCVRTRYGPVDVITRFADGTTIDSPAPDPARCAA